MKIEKTCKTLAFVGAAVVSLLAAGADVWRAELLIPEPQPVRTRFGGRVGAKFDALVRERCLSEDAKGRFYEETVNAFRTHYDDLAKPGNGYWQGEYWGKNMLALIAGARYAGDAELEDFIVTKTRAFVREFQRADGYIGTYRDDAFVVPTDPQRRRMCWNLWGRKYTLWALLEVYRLSHDRFFLDAAAKLYDQQLALLARLGLKLRDTGCFDGMPSLSVLKPLLVLAQETKGAKYLDSAKEIVAEMDDPDPSNPAPNLVRNAFRDEPVYDWYPKSADSIRAHTKAYEMMSCYEGLVAYARMTGARRTLEAAERFADKLAAHELNAMGSVGFMDGFCAASARNNGISEYCDVIHWIRLCDDLYRATGHPRHLDRMERAFLNAGLAGFFRDGTWAMHGVRSHGYGNFKSPKQVAMEYHQCCVDNAPRLVTTMADAAVVEAEDGTVDVNFYMDFTAKLSDGALTATGDYPVGDVVAVTLASARPRTVRLRVPGWCRRMTVDGETVKGPFVRMEPAANRTWKIGFDMTPEVVMSSNAAHPELTEASLVGELFVRRHYLNLDFGREKAAQYASPLRREPAAHIRRGPLVLAKTAKLGDTAAEIFGFATVNGKDVRAALEPIPATATWGAWKLSLQTPDGKVETKVSDLATAADDGGYDAFSVWF